MQYQVQINTKYKSIQSKNQYLVKINTNYKKIRSTNQYEVKTNTKYKSIRSKNQGGESSLQERVLKAAALTSTVCPLIGNKLLKKEVLSTPEKTDCSAQNLKIFLFLSIFISAGNLLKFCSRASSEYE